MFLEASVTPMVSLNFIFIEKFVIQLTLMQSILAMCESIF